MVFFSLPFYLFVYHCLAKNERNHPFQAPLEDFKGHTVFMCYSGSSAFCSGFFLGGGVGIKWRWATEVKPSASPETSC